MFNKLSAQDRAVIAAVNSGESGPVERAYHMREDAELARFAQDYGTGRAANVQLNGLDFQDMVQAVAMFTDTKLAHPMLESVRVELDGTGTLKLTATDRYTALQAATLAGYGDQAFTVDVNGAELLAAVKHYKFRESDTVALAFDGVEFKIYALGVGAKLSGQDHGLGKVTGMVTELFAKDTAPLSEFKFDGALMARFGKLKLRRKDKRVPLMIEFLGDSKAARVSGESGRITYRALIMPMRPGA